MDESNPHPELHPLEAAQKQRGILLRLVRLSFLVLFFTVMLLIVLDTEPGGNVADATTFLGIALSIQWRVVVGVALLIAFSILLIEALVPQKKISTLFSVVFGLLVALLATVALGFVIDLLATTYDIADGNLIAAIKVLVGIALAYLAVTTVLETQDDFRLVIPYVEFAKQIRGPRPLLLDSSALIDARVVDLGQTGILQSPIVVPRFVVAELQLLADSGDKLKRTRGRRGLDVIGRLQRIAGLDVTVDETPVPGKAVDQMLVEMGRTMPAMIVTTDVALARIASIQGVKTLNLNDVANAMKPALVPGEQVEIVLLKPGEQRGQAVGYLDDGTMVVAEDGAEHIGQRVTLAVTSTLQTSAGRLLFGRLQKADSDADSPARLAPAVPPLLESPPEVEGSPDDAGEPAMPPAAPSLRSPFPPNAPNPRANRARNPRR